jgi:hypothetical protein
VEGQQGADASARAGCSCKLDERSSRRQALLKPKHVLQTFLHELRFCPASKASRERWRRSVAKDLGFEGLAGMTIPPTSEEDRMDYRCEATSISGFIQQLAVGYVGRGYFFYVLGQVPDGKDPRRIDEKLIATSKAARARRKALGYANLQYIRYRETFVLLATPGKHEFFLQEAGQIRDAREVPIKVFGYAVSFRAGHPHVRIEQQRYLDLKSYFSDIAVHRSRETLEQQLHSLRFEPYAPVRSQFHVILREINGKRKKAGFAPLPSSCLRTRRRIVKPFGVQEDGTGGTPETGCPSCASIEADVCVYMDMR